MLGENDAEWLSKGPAPVKREGHIRGADGGQQPSRMVPLGCGGREWLGFAWMPYLIDSTGGR